jgi:probable rRNA maturation factor
MSVSDQLPPDVAEDGPAIQVIVSNRQDVDLNEDELALVARAALEGEDVRPPAELSLSFVTSEEMEHLHVRYMGEEGPTDVLSFPMGEDGLVGDVVVCPEEALRAGRDVATELRVLVVHGVLHLLGYDHDRDQDRLVMWAKQERYAVVSP